MTGGISEDRDHLKRLAADRAVEEVEDGMILGLGTGSTAAHVLERLSERVAGGLKVAGIPTSERTAVQARRLGIPITSFAEHDEIDLAIDGADEVERGTLNLIKGLGGALLREKIVAAASARFIVVVDHEKIVGRLGEHTPVPVEVAQFGWQATARALGQLGCVPELRYAVADRPYVTDGGNFILDCRFRSLADPQTIEREIAMTVGTIESGLFVGRSSAVIVASAAGVEVLTPPVPPRAKTSKRNIE
jgi:ribose 5-phosphate isomerase A